MDWFPYRNDYGCETLQSHRERNAGRTWQKSIKSRGTCGGQVGISVFSHLKNDEKLRNIQRGVTRMVKDTEWWCRLRLSDLVKRQRKDNIWEAYKSRVVWRGWTGTECSGARTIPWPPAGIPPVGSRLHTNKRPRSLQDVQVSGGTPYHRLLWRLKGFKGRWGKFREDKFQWELVNTKTSLLAWEVPELQAGGRRGQIWVQHLHRLVQVYALPSPSSLGRSWRQDVGRDGPVLCCSLAASLLHPYAKCLRPLTCSCVNPLRLQLSHQSYSP